MEPLLKPAFFLAAVIRNLTHRLPHLLIHPAVGSLPLEQSSQVDLKKIGQRNQQIEIRQIFAGFPNLKR